jgi:hypothetical protein
MNAYIHGEEIEKKKKKKRWVETEIKQKKGRCEKGGGKSK